MIVRVLPAIAALALLAHGAPGNKAVIEECRYTTDAVAQAAWQPMKGTAPVSVATIEGRKALRMPCNDAGSQVERASWDRKGTFDLSPYQGVEFQFFTTNPAPVSHYSIYFESGGGWCSATFFPASQSRWETIHIAGKTPVYPGIGASATASHMGADRIIGQIQITRKHQTDGFVIFNYGVTETKDLLPMLGLGITAKR